MILIMSGKQCTLEDCYPLSQGCPLTAGESLSASASTCEGMCVSRVHGSVLHISLLSGHEKTGDVGKQHWCSGELWDVHSRNHCMRVIDLSE